MVQNRYSPTAIIDEIAADKVMSTATQKHNSNGAAINHAGSPRIESRINSIQHDRKGDEQGDINWDAIQTYVSVPLTSKAIRIINRIASNENKSVTEILCGIVEREILRLEPTLG